MCVIISGETQPDTTKLMNIPVVVNGVESNFFMYINNFDLSKPNEIKFNSLIEDSYQDNKMFSRLYQDLNTFNLKQNNGSLMVVPFAVDAHTPSSQIGLVDITTHEMKQLRTNIKSLKPVSKNYTLSMNYSRGIEFDSDKKIEVHKIGNYNISVATSRLKLLNNIDWNKFTKPDDYDKRINTFLNKELYPNKYAYFYIVAEAIENIKDDGFGVVYPRLSDGNIYMPTAHEDTSRFHDFDVELFTFGKNLNNSLYSDKKMLHNELQNLQNVNVKMLNNTYQKMNFDKDINTFLYDKIKGNIENHNIFLN
jgi:hypothetical protein